MKAERSSRSSLLDLFPTPQYMRMNAFGLDVTDDVVRIVEFKRKGKHYVLGQYGSEKLPDDLIEEGYIKDRPRLTEILTVIRRKYGIHFVNVSLPEEKTYLFKTEIPFMDEADIRSALKFKIEENVPVPLASAVYDYRIIKKPEPGDKTISVSVTVVHNKVATRYFEVFKNAGMMPIGFQAESHAIARAAVPCHEKGTFIVVAVRGTKTVLSVVSEGEVQFTSTVHIGGNAIAASLKKNLSIDEQEVDMIRRGKEVRDSNEMFMSLVSAASALRDDVQKLLTYWGGHSLEQGLNRQIEGIILTGSDSMLGLDEYLGRSLDIKTTIANPWANIITVNEYVPPLTKREALDYLPAIGLALPYD